VNVPIYHSNLKYLDQTIELTTTKDSAWKLGKGCLDRKYKARVEVISCGTHKLTIMHND
jgi:hypothetical protein